MIKIIAGFLWLFTVTVIIENSPMIGGIIALLSIIALVIWIYQNRQRLRNSISRRNR